MNKLKEFFEILAAMLALLLILASSDLDEMLEWVKENAGVLL